MTKQLALAFFVLTAATNSLFTAAHPLPQRSHFGTIFDSLVIQTKKTKLRTIVEEGVFCIVCEKDIITSHGDKPACLAHLPTTEPIELHIAHYNCHMEKLFERDLRCLCGEQLIRGDYTINMALQDALRYNDELLAKALIDAGAINTPAPSPQSVSGNLEHETAAGKNLLLDDDDMLEDY